MLGVVGTRYPEDILSYERFVEYLTPVVKHYSITKLISGGAKGIDSYVKRYAIEFEFPLVEYSITKEMYAKYGKRAPLERNGLIVKDCNILLAFPRETGPEHLKSRGTYDTIRKAEQLGKPTIIIKL